MRRAGLWLRWSLRDLRARWALVLAIGLVIAVGTGLYAGLGSMENWRIASNDASFVALRAHDLEVSLTEGTSVPTGTLEALASRGPLREQVAAAQERLVLPTQVDIPRSSGGSLLVPGEVIGSPLGPRGPAIDGVYAESGRTLNGTDEGRPTAVLEVNFASFHDLPLHGRLVLPGGARLRYVGLGGSPEHFLVTRPGGGDFGGAEAQFALVFASLRTAQRLAGAAVVNDVVLRLHEGAEARVARRQLERRLRAAGLSGEVTTLAQEPAHRVLYEDAHGDQRLFNVFAILILAGAALAAFNLATRIVEAQRREIGIGMALGVPPHELAVRPLLLGVQIALVGTALGLVLGLFMGEIFRGVLEDLLPLPEMRTPFELGVFLRAALLGLLLPIAATAVPVWRGVRTSPVEAIEVGFRAARSSGLARLGTALRLPGSSVAQMPLRNAMRAPRRTALTILGIGAVLSVLIAFMGLIDSFLATVDRSRAEVAQGNPGRLTATLAEYGPDHATVRAVRRAGGVAAVEPRAQLPVTLGAPGKTSISGALTVLDLESRIWTPTIVTGDKRSAKPGILIATEAARDLGVGVGDEISLTYPRPRGGRLVEARARLPISGLHPDPFRIFAYMDRRAAAALGIPRWANQVAIVPQPGAGQAVRRALFGIPGVASVERATATTDFVRERLDDFLGVLRLIEGFALALTLLIAFNSASIGIEERRRENATMLAFGVPLRRVIGVAVVESLIAGALGTLVGLAGGYAVVGWVTQETLPETLPDLGLAIRIAPGSLLFAVLVSTAAVAAAPLAGALRLRRVDIPSTLRVME